MNKTKASISLTTLLLIMFMVSGCNPSQEDQDITSVPTSISQTLTTSEPTLTIFNDSTPVSILTPTSSNTPTTTLVAPLPSATPSKIIPSPTPSATPEFLVEAGSKGGMLYREKGNLWFLDVSIKKTKQLNLDGRGGSRVLNVAWSPDGQFFVYNKDGELRLSDIEGASSREIASNATLTPRWVNTTAIKYCQYADKTDKINNPCFLFDITTGTITNLQTDNYGEFAYSPDLSKVLVQEFDTSGAYIQPQLNLYLLDLEMNNKIFERETGIWTTTPEWISDGNKVVFTASAVNDELSGDVFVVEANGENLTQLTNFSQTETAPTLPVFVRWSPNEAWLALILVTRVSKELVILKSDGSALKRLGVEWVTLGEPNVTPIWSPDSQQIAFLSNKIDKNGWWQIYTVDIETLEISQLTSFWCKTSSKTTR